MITRDAPMAIAPPPAHPRPGRHRRTDQGRRTGPGTAPGQRRRVMPARPGSIAYLTGVLCIPLIIGGLYLAHHPRPQHIPRCATHQLCAWRYPPTGGR